MRCKSFKKQTVEKYLLVVDDMFNFYLFFIPFGTKLSKVDTQKSTKQIKMSCFVGWCKLSFFFFFSFGLHNIYYLEKGLELKPITENHHRLYGWINF